MSFDSLQNALDVFEMRDILAGCGSSYGSSYGTDCWYGGGSNMLPTVDCFAPAPTNYTLVVSSPYGNSVDTMNYYNANGSNSYTGGASSSTACCSGSTVASTTSTITPIPFSNGISTALSAIGLGVDAEVATMSVIQALVKDSPALLAKIGNYAGVAGAVVNAETIISDYKQGIWNDNDTIALVSVLSTVTSIIFPEIPAAILAVTSLWCVYEDMRILVEDYNAAHNGGTW